MTTFSITVDFLTPFLKTWKFNEKPLVLSISGPQGSGKSYLSRQLAQFFKEFGPKPLVSVIISTDDLYLNHKDLKDVTEAHPNNKLLAGRGLPGTHDVDLGYKLLSKLIDRETGFKIPVYNKAAFNGEGDRDVIENWIDVETPVDIVILEGWFNGFLPYEDESDITEKYNESPLLQQYSLDDIFEINSNLDEYSKLWSLFDIAIYLDTDDLNYIYDWRTEQEHELIKKKGAGMTDAQVKNFITRYMVIYQLYLIDLMQKGLPALKKHRSLRIDLGHDREIKETAIY